MRNYIFFTFFIVVFIFMTVNVFADRAHHDELIDMADFVTETHSIKSWHVTIKESIDQEKLPQLLTKLHSDFSVTTEENKKIIKIIAKDPHKKNGLNECFNVVIPKSNNQQAELIAIMEGNQWDRSVKHTYQQKLDEIVQNYFTDSKQKFSWLTFVDDDKIDSNVFLNEMVAQWNMENLQLQLDNHLQNRKVLYGYTPVWQEYIRMQNDRVNMQIALHTDNQGTTTYTLGTPILINEY